MPKLIGYAPTGLIYTPRRNSWGLRVGFDRARHCVAFATRSSGNQVDLIRDRNGEGIGSGSCQSSECYEIEGAGGEVIYIDKIEVDGVIVGYTSTAPLQPGLAYTHIRTWDYAADVVPVAHLKGCPAFGPDTLITTDKGDIPVQWLNRGSKVLTRDNGIRPLRWVGRTHMSALNMRYNLQCSPIRIASRVVDPKAAAGFIGVSPETGLLVRGAEVKRLFDEEEVLIPAKFIADQKQPEFPYHRCTLHHLLFVDHQVVLANGIWCESLLLPPPDQRPNTDWAIYPPRGVFHTREARRCLTQDQAGLLLRQRATHMQSVGCMLA